MVVFSMILWSHNYFLSRRMRYQYEFYISQGSVATVLRGDEQNYSHLRQVSS